MSIEDKFEKNIKLAPFTSFKIGGPAKLFVEAYGSDEIIESIKWAGAHSIDYFMLGGGSNILVNDAGYDGLVIKNVSSGIKFDGNIISCDSGTTLSRLVQMAENHGFSGLEWAAGLPGTVGGAIIGNAACFGSEMAAITEEVEVYDPEEDKIFTLNNTQCDFAYRHSIFKAKKLVMLSCKIKLNSADAAVIRAKTEEVINKRLIQQPKYPSAGSVFKNIPLADVHDQKLLDEAAAKNKVVGAGNGGIATAWLIEEMHLKGKSIGGAEVSTEHSNFIVNRDFKATAEDVIMLISFIKQQVRMNYNVMLKEELQYVGF